VGISDAIPTICRTRITPATTSGSLSSTNSTATTSPLRWSRRLSRLANIANGLHRERRSRWRMPQNVALRGRLICSHCRDDEDLKCSHAHKSVMLVTYDNTIWCFSHQFSFASDPRCLRAVFSLGVDMFLNPSLHRSLNRMRSDFSGSAVRGLACGFGGNFQNAELSKAFISSDEYRHRFGP
jgi:hypothetical protein